jgi:hypothetical protein
MPGKNIVDQELGLFAFFDHWIAEIGTSYSIPINHIQFRTALIKISKSCSGIPVRKGPTNIFPIRPIHDRFHISLQVENGVLTATIGHVGVVVTIDDKEHDGAGAEVERHIIADLGAWMAENIQLERAPLFYRGHTDGGMVLSLPETPSIRFYTPNGHNRGKIVDMGDMENLRLRRRWCHLFDFPL